ncbi:MAG: DNA polymerase III subunit delta [Armatimonadota bacterium]
MNQKFTHLPKSGDIPVQGTWLLVQGDEEHLKRTLVERLRGQLLAAEDEFNLDQLDVSERWEGIVDSADQAKRERLPSRAERILALAAALPFLGSGRLLIVRNADLLATDQQKKLAAGLASVPPMNHVLLVTGDGGKDARKAAKLAPDLLKGIAEKGTIYDCAALNENEAGEWVREKLKEWGQAIEPAALQMLLTRTGTELRRLQVETEKLSLLAGDNGRIRIQDVELLTPKQAEESVFRLVDAVAARNAAQAMAVLHELLTVQLEQPYRIFPLIVRQFRLIWQTKVLLEAGWRPGQPPESFPQALALLPEQNVTAQLKNSWMGNKLAGPARQLSWEHLQSAYQALLECDMASKAIEGVPRQEMDVALEMLCAKLCAPSRR